MRLWLIHWFCLVIFLSVWEQPVFAIEEVIRTSTGVPLKVIVGVDTMIHERPDLNSPGRAVQALEVCYVMPPTAEASLTLAPSEIDRALDHGFLRITSTVKDPIPLGWVEIGHVMPWSHNLVLRQQFPTNRMPSRFFRTRADLESSVRELKRNGPKPAIETLSKGGKLDLLPILNEIKINDPAGDERTGYEVATLALLASNSHTEDQAGRAGSRSMTLDVVFVIDTTAGMEPCIEMLKELVRTLAQKLATDPNQSIPVRLGLVAYRDRIVAEVPGWYLTKVFWDLNQTAEITADSPGKGTNLTAFLEVLETVKAATAGSEDIPEDILGGLREAIKLPSWNPNAFKHIVLIGDASGHVESSDPKNVEKLSIEGIKAMMQPPGKENAKAKIICSAIRFESAEGPEDGPLADRHFTILAEGVNYPGFFNSLKKDEGKKFVDEMVTFFNTSRAGMITLLTEDSRRSLKPDPVVKPKEPAALNPAVAELPIEANSQAFGPRYFLAGDLDREPKYAPAVLVTYQQLETYEIILSFCLNALKTGGDRTSNQTIGVIQGASIKLCLGLPIPQDGPSEKNLAMAALLPVKPDVLRMTPRHLANMTERDFEQWLKRLENCESVIKAHLEDPRRWRTSGLDANRGSRQSLIWLSELP